MMAKEQERSHLISMLLLVITQIPCPRPESSGRGRPPEHSKDKLDFACLWMMSNNATYRDTESDLRNMRLPWREPIPDHTTIVKHMQTEVGV
jgi:hypothetical protein